MTTRVNNINTFIAGDTIRLSVRFEVKDVLTDPRSVNFKIKNPNQSVQNLNYDEDVVSTDRPFREATGIYHIDKKVDLPGEWWFRWESTNPAPGAFEGRFRVVASNVIG